MTLRRLPRWSPFGRTVRLAAIDVNGEPCRAEEVHTNLADFWRKTFEKQHDDFPEEEAKVFLDSFGVRLGLTPEAASDRRGTGLCPPEHAFHGCALATAKGVLRGRTGYRTAAGGGPGQRPSARSR